MQTVKLFVPYGPLKRGQEYKVVSEGRDYVRVKRGGNLIYVPDALIAPPGYRFDNTWERDEEDEEEYYN